MSRVNVGVVRLQTTITRYRFTIIPIFKDLSGPYPTSLSGNRYDTFTDLYSGWPETYSVPDNSADKIMNKKVR